MTSRDGSSRSADHHTTFHPMTLTDSGTFLYPPHAHYELAQQDALRFQQAGVEGFQLDSVYGGLFVEKTGC